MIASGRAIALLIALILAPAVLPGAGFGQIPDEPNTIGIYFDTMACMNCVNGATPYTPLTAYLLAVNVSEPSGISGWECSLLTDPATFPAPATITVDGGGVNALAPPDFDVALPAVVPQARVVRLATWSMFYFGGPVLFGIGPSHPGHFVEASGPGYVAGDGSMRRARLFVGPSVPMSGSTDVLLAAGVNSPVWICPDWVPGYVPCSTRNEVQTWGAVKGLYR